MLAIDKIGLLKNEQHILTVGKNNIIFITNLCYKGSIKRIDEFIDALGRNGVTLLPHISFVVAYI
jgi:hypothetical protein